MSNTNITHFSQLCTVNLVTHNWIAGHRSITCIQLLKEWQLFGFLEQVWYHQPGLFQYHSSYLSSKRSGNYQAIKNGSIDLHVTTQTKASQTALVTLTAVTHCAISLVMGLIWSFSNGWKYTLEMIAWEWKQGMVQHAGKVKFVKQRRNSQRFC